MLNYFEVAFPTEKPIWTTPNDIVYETACVVLRCFRVSDGESTLVLPPQAGHSSHIADHDKSQSLIQTVLDNSEGSVYCIEWKGATQETKDTSLDDLVTQVMTAVRYIGPLHIIGLCQGGWLATICAARYPSRFLSLTPIAAPIDFHISGGTIFDAITESGMGPYRAIVEGNNGVMPGAGMLLAWKMSHMYERYYGDFADIFRACMNNEQEKLRKILRFRTWYEASQDLAGVWYQEACDLLFLQNLLIQGKLMIHGEYVDLSQITCKVAMLAGADDDITLEDQLFALGDYVLGPIMEILIPKCGHIGCFMGTKSQAYIAEAVRWTHG